MGDTSSLARTPVSLTRRRLLAGAGASLTAVSLPRALHAEPLTSDGFRVLRARPGQTRLRGDREPPTAIWGYDGAVPGPTLRIRQGDELKVRLVNDLSQPTVIHWHGLRLPNAMDGVPHLTQMPVEPGASFDYRFTAPDAGTFWYHSHFMSSEQVERGLYGVLVVEEPQPAAVDRDVVLVLDDWRLTGSGAIHPSFGNMHDAAMAGRLGQYVTLNSADISMCRYGPTSAFGCASSMPAMRGFSGSGSRNTRCGSWRSMGSPAPLMSRPAGLCGWGRATAPICFSTPPQAPGARASILVDDLRGGELEIGRIVYDTGPPLRAAPLFPRRLRCRTIRCRRPSTSPMRWCATCRSMAAAWA